MDSVLAARKQQNGEPILMETKIWKYEKKRSVILGKIEKKMKIRTKKKGNKAMKT